MRRPLHEEFALRPIAERGPTKGGVRRKNKPQSVAYRPAEGLSCVYAIGCDDHEFVKFGRSVSPHARLKALQTSSPHELRFLCIVEVAKASVCALEREIHRSLGIAGLAGEGEWWNVPFPMLYVFISSAAERQGIEVIKWMGGCDQEDGKERIAPHATPTQSICNRPGGPKRVRNVLQRYGG